MTSIATLRAGARDRMKHMGVFLRQLVATDSLNPMAVGVMVMTAATSGTLQFIVRFVLKALFNPRPSEE
jgi:hypothetical protein